nr:transporter substrate-binding domain-containing protein [uncultured Undibacterium sp.]
MYGRILLFVLILSSLSCNVQAQGQALQFGRNEKLPEQDVAEAIFLTALKNIKLPVQIQALPPARATKYNKSLHLSGEIARIHSYGESHTDLIRVIPSYYQLYSAVYVKKNSPLEIESIKDLENLRVGHVHGVQHSLDIVKGLKNVQTVSESKNLFNMLFADRFDAVITTTIDGQLMLEQMKLVNDVRSTVLGTKELFVYLNKNTAHLAKEIGTELARMKKNNEIEKIIEIKRLELTRSKPPIQIN